MRPKKTISCKKSDFPRAFAAVCTASAVERGIGVKSDNFKNYVFSSEKCNFYYFSKMMFIML